MLIFISNPFLSLNFKDLDNVESILFKRWNRWTISIRIYKKS